MHTTKPPYRKPITKTEAAKALGVTREWLSMVLNGHHKTGSYAGAARKLETRYAKWVKDQEADS